MVITQMIIITIIIRDQPNSRGKMCNFTVVLKIR